MRLHPVLQRTLDAHGTFFTDEARDLALEPAVLQRLLAARFSYHVQKGGFAQLLFNTKGTFLREIEQMLVSLGATRAQDAYVAAIDLAVADVDRWERFRSSNYVSDEGLRPLLTTLSLGYFRGGPSFEEEIAATLERWARETPLPAAPTAPAPRPVAPAPASTGLRQLGCVVAIVLAVAVIFGIPVYRYATGAMDRRPPPAARP